MSALDLRALDGANPLGFLAALGALRAVTALFGPDVTMEWGQVTRYPRIEPGSELNPTGLSRTIARWLTARSQDFRIEDPLTKKPYKNLNIPKKVFRDLARHEGPQGRLEVLACLGTDATAGPLIADTDFRTMSGAGHQHYLESIAKLGELTTEEDVRRALFEPWKYEDDLPYLRLDPKDDRRYALRWQDPSRQTKGFEIRTVRGANRLAVEGLRLYPVIPGSGRIRTSGFQRLDGEFLWTWPLWDRPINLDTVRSLLALGRLQSLGAEHSDDRRCLDAMGVSQIFRSRRITIGKMRNFTPARAM